MINIQEFTKEVNGEIVPDILKLHDYNWQLVKQNPKPINGVRMYQTYYNEQSSSYTDLQFFKSLGNRIHCKVLRFDTLGDIKHIPQYIQLVKKIFDGKMTFDEIPENTPFNL